MTKTLAISGISGALGKYIIEAVTSPLFRNHFNFPIHALTRDASKYEDTEDVKYYSAGDFQDRETVGKALQGVDVLIDAVGFAVNPCILAEAAADAGVKLFFPSVYGSDHSKSKFDPMYSRFGVMDVARGKGMKTVELVIGWFIEWNLSNTVMGIDYDKLELTRFNGGNYPIACTAETDVAKILVSLAHHEPSELPDVVKLNGDNLTINNASELFQKVTGKKLKTIDVSKDQIMAEAQKVLEMNPKDMNFGHIITVLQATATEDGTSQFDKDDSSWVNPGLWEWTKFDTLANKIWASK